MWPRFSTTLNAPCAGLGDVHVHPHVVLAGHHLGRTARALRDARVVERLDDVVGVERAGLVDGRLPELEARYVPVHALPAVNIALPG